MLEKSTVETNAKYGIETGDDCLEAPRIQEVIPEFLRYCQYERNMARESIRKYSDCMVWIVRGFGNIAVTNISRDHITVLKMKTIKRGVGNARISSIIFCLKSFLTFCNEIKGFNVLDSKQIRPPKIENREVVYLTNDEVKLLVESIPIENKGRGAKSSINTAALRFRVLVELLLVSGMRISEALSLNRSDINYDNYQAQIIGKGNKQRTVFFNEQVIWWIKYYLEVRNDSFEPIFITDRNTRLSRADVSGLFRRYCKRINIPKQITPHILRHTMATNLLFNGCPIGHIKEILGHEKLETTCKYYLGLDKKLAQQAHQQYLRFDS